MDTPTRKPNRLNGYDYSADGAYFITICAKDRKCLFSKVIVGGGVLDAPQTNLTAYGLCIKDRIESMNRAYHDIQAAKYVIMPNHLHILLEVFNADMGTSRTPSPTNARVPQYISTLKRMCNAQCGTNLFQRSYHDHVIRGERDYQMIWEYIDTNPAKWREDELYIE